MKFLIEHIQEAVVHELDFVAFSIFYVEVNGECNGTDRVLQIRMADCRIVDKYS